MRFALLGSKNFSRDLNRAYSLSEECSGVPLVQEALVPVYYTAHCFDRHQKSRRICSVRLTLSQSFLIRLLEERQCADVYLCVKSFSKDSTYMNTSFQSHQDNDL